MRYTTHVDFLLTSLAGSAHHVVKALLGRQRFSNVFASGHGSYRTWIPYKKSPSSIGTIPGTTICGLADGGLGQLTALKKFRSEFETT